MTNYYILDFAVDTKETGSQFPQIQAMAPNYDYGASNSVHFLKGGSFPNFIPNLNYFVLHNRSKPTDLISEATTGGGGFLISEKLKNIFEEFNLIPHKYYPAKLMHKDVLYHNYYWMHLVADLTDFVDYPKSKFFIYKNYSTNEGYIDIYSKQYLFEKRKDIEQSNSKLTIWSEKIKLASDFDYSLDLFKISCFDSNYYINERINERLINEKMTGLKISMANNLI